MYDANKILCFGVYIRVLQKCCTHNISQEFLVVEIAKTVEPDGEFIMDDGAISRWVNCKRGVTIRKQAQQASFEEVSSKFLKGIIPLLNEDRKVLSVLALLDIIEKDNASNCTHKESFKKYFGKTKDVLLAQSEFVLHEFLAASFLYATACVDNKDGESCVKSIDDAYIEMFFNTKDKIRLVDELTAPDSGTNTEEFNDSDSNVSSLITQIFISAIQDFHIVDFVDEDPTTIVHLNLVDSANDFIDNIKIKVLRQYFDNQNEEVYTKVLEFSQVLTDYIQYLSYNMEPHATKTSVLVPVHKDICYKQKTTSIGKLDMNLTDTTLEYKSRLNTIYNELANGKMLIKP